MGDAPAQPAVARGVPQEVHDLRQLRLGLVDAGDVGEGDADLFRVGTPGAGAPEAAERAHRAAFRGAPREQHEKADDQQRGAEAEQQRRP